MISSSLGIEVAGKRVQTLLLLGLLFCLSETALHRTLAGKAIVFGIASAFSPTQRIEILVVA